LQNQKPTEKMKKKPEATTPPNPLAPTTTPAALAQQKAVKTQPQLSTKPPTGQKTQLKGAKAKAATTTTAMATPSTPISAPTPPRTATPPPPPPKEPKEETRRVPEAAGETKGVVEPVAGQQAVDGPPKEVAEVKEAEKKVEKAEERAPKVDDAKTDVTKVDAVNMVDTVKDKKTDEVDKPKVDVQGEVAKEDQVKADTKVDGVTKDDAKVEGKKEVPLLANGTAVPTSDLIGLDIPVVDAPALGQPIKSPRFSNNPYLNDHPAARGPQFFDMAPISPLDKIDSAATSLVGAIGSFWNGPSNNSSASSGPMSWARGNSNVS